MDRSCGMRKSPGPFRVVTNTDKIDIDHLGECPASMDVAVFQQRSRRRAIREGGSWRARGYPSVIWENKASSCIYAHDSSFLDIQKKGRQGAA